MTLAKQFKEEAKIWVLDALVMCSPRLLGRLLAHYFPRYLHILNERKAMTRTLWFSVMNDDSWTCYLCGMQNWRNLDPAKPKMQVDHVVPLYRFGATARDNLRACCRKCNLKKGVK